MERKEKSPATAGFFLLQKNARKKARRQPGGFAKQERREKARRQPGFFLNGLSPGSVHFHFYTTINLQTSNLVCLAGGFCSIPRVRLMGSILNPRKMPISILDRRIRQALAGLFRLPNRADKSGRRMTTRAMAFFLSRVCSNVKSWEFSLLSRANK